MEVQVWDNKVQDEDIYEVQELSDEELVNAARELQEGQERQQDLVLAEQAKDNNEEGLIMEQS